MINSNKFILLINNINKIDLTDLQVENNVLHLKYKGKPFQIQIESSVTSYIKLEKDTLEIVNKEAILKVTNKNK